MTHYTIVDFSETITPVGGKAAYILLAPDPALAGALGSGMMMVMIYQSIFFGLSDKFDR